MNFANKLKDTIDRFSPISLKEMDRVRFMRRTDTKYILEIEKMPILLEKVLADYYMVEINHIREQLYETTYFDTNDYQMYTIHHNGKLNRHKIRIRKYVFSDMAFLEVKKKNNRGETIKNRIPKEDEGHHLDFEGSGSFLEKYTPYNHELLWPKLGNRFIRLTLVNKDLSERITLDYDLRFTDLKYHKQIQTEGICIVEIKRNRDHQNSPFVKALSEFRVFPSGFSKYCMGLAMLNPEIKTNIFKQKIKKITDL
ncbi:MAG TPA: polyphosphate polymerase domain-containing protein [Prolixibacteraceae bacterium]|nr:polyphosphate polymerase domain-containing protein [Prolixibacteraceae bacterium]